MSTYDINVAAFKNRTAQVDLSKYNASSVASTYNAAKASTAQTASDAASYNVDSSTAKVDKATDVISKVTMATAALTGAATLFSTIKGITDGFKSSGGTSTTAQNLDTAMKAFDGSKKSSKALGKAITQYENGDLATAKKNYEDLQKQYTDLETAMTDDNTLKDSAKTRMAEIDAEITGEKGIDKQIQSCNDAYGAAEGAKAALEQQKEAIINNEQGKSIKAAWDKAEEDLPNLESTYSTYSNDFTKAKGTLAADEAKLKSWKNMEKGADKVGGSVVSEADIKALEESIKTQKDALKTLEDNMKEAEKAVDAKKQEIESYKNQLEELSNMQHGALDKIENDIKTQEDLMKTNKENGEKLLDQKNELLKEKERLDAASDDSNELSGAIRTEYKNELIDKQNELVDKLNAAKEVYEACQAKANEARKVADLEPTELKLGDKKSEKAKNETITSAELDEMNRLYGKDVDFLGNERIKTWNDGEDKIGKGVDEDKNGIDDAIDKENKRINNEYGASELRKKLRDGRDAVKGLFS